MSAIPVFLSSLSFPAIRRLDRRIARPVLRLLGLLPGKRTARGKSSIPSRVICCQFLGMGRMVLALPLLHELKRNQAKVVFCAFEGQADLAELSGLVDEVWIVRPTLFGVLSSFWKMFWKSRRFKPDAFLDLESTMHLSAVLARLSGAPIRIGFLALNPLREKTYTHLVSLAASRHLTESYLSMAKLLGIKPDDKDAIPDLPLPDLTKVQNVFPDLPRRRKVVINTNPSDPGAYRAWPEEHWVELCNQLLQQRDLDLIFVGGREDRPRVQSLLAKVKDPLRVFNLAGQIKLVELLKLLHRADLAVCVEGGTMHLASWAGTPLVALFGPDSPKISGPRAKRSFVLYADVPCSPCVFASLNQQPLCKDNICMKKIKPAQVLQACQLLLNEKKPDQGAA